MAYAAPRDRGLYDFSDGRDGAVLEHFGAMGIHAAKAKEWRVDPRPHHPPLCTPDRGNLYVWVCTDHVLKVPKDIAERILVLGVP